MTLVENKFLHYLLTETEKPAVLAIICCLLNVVMVGYQPVGWLPYDHLLFQVCVSDDYVVLDCVSVLVCYCVFYVWYCVFYVSYFVFYIASLAFILKYVLSIRTRGNCSVFSVYMF